MTATKTTSEGILAIWRMGRETVPKSPLAKGLGQSLFVAGEVSFPMLLESTYCSQGFEYPGTSSIADDEFYGAKELNEAATEAGVDVVCIRYRNARLGERAIMGDTLRCGYSSILENTRRRAGISNPRVSRTSEAARLAYVGALYIPQPRIELPDAMVQLGLAQTAK